MTRSTIAIHEILEGLETLTVDVDAKHKFRQLVVAIAVAHGYAFVESAARVAFARDLLRARVARPLVRNRLMVLYEISRPQAYRIISHALQAVS